MIFPKCRGFFFKLTNVSEDTLQKYDFSLEGGIVESELYTYLKMNYFC